MKRTLLTLGVLVGIGIGGGAWVSAQTAPAPKAARLMTTRPLPRAQAPRRAAWAMGTMGGGSMCGGHDGRRHGMGGGMGWAAAWARWG